MLVRFGVEARARPGGVLVGQLLNRPVRDDGHEAWREPNNGPRSYGEPREASRGPRKVDAMSCAPTLPLVGNWGTLIRAGPRDDTLAWPARRAAGRRSAAIQRVVGGAS